MTDVVKVKMAKGSTFMVTSPISGDTEYTLKGDLWTSLKTYGEEVSDRVIKSMVRDNLAKQIAKDMFGNIRMWKRIYIDFSDMEVARE